MFLVLIMKAAATLNAANFQKKENPSTIVVLLMNVFNVDESDLTMPNDAF